MPILYFHSLHGQFLYGGFHKYNLPTAVPIQCNIQLSQLSIPLNRKKTQEFCKIKINHYRRYLNIARKEHIRKFGMVEHC